MPSETIGEITLKHTENECYVEWKMHFPSLSTWIGSCYTSPRFSFEGIAWYLGMWPNGIYHYNSEGFIDLALQRHSYNGPPINVEFAFALKTIYGQKDSEKRKTEVFKQRSHHDIELFLSKYDFDRRQHEFLAFEFLTVICTLKKITSTGEASTSAVKKCFSCKGTLEAEFIPLHETCINRPIKCLDCSDVVLLTNWLHDHECEKTKTEECSYCKKNVDAENISTHERKCMDRPIKCPECSEVVFLQKWHDHECQAVRPEGETNAVKSSAVCHYDKILHDLKHLFLNQEHCDVVLRVKGREFHAHKAILSARSTVFASTFRNDMKEKETGIVDIEDCDSSIFQDFLSFLYSNDVDSLSTENVFGLFTASDKYDIPDLRKICLEFMKENLSVEIFCDTLTLALQHTETELIPLTTDFFIKNAKKILVTVKWQSFAAENPTESNELVIKLVASYSSSKS